MQPILIMQLWSLVKILNYFPRNKPATGLRWSCDLVCLVSLSQASFRRTTWESCWPLWVIVSQTTKSTSSSEKHRSIKRATSTTWSSPVFLNTEPKTKTIKQAKRPLEERNPCCVRSPLTLIYWTRIKCLLCATYWNKISYFKWVMIYNHS